MAPIGGYAVFESSNDVPWPRWRAGSIGRSDWAGQRWSASRHHPISPNADWRIAPWWVELRW